MNRCPSFRVIFSEDKIGVIFNEDKIGVIFNEDKMHVGFQQVQTITEPSNPYDGQYSIRPKINEQILPTKDRLLSENVVVQAIPVIRTSNTSGGITIYIANEV